MRFESWITKLSLSIPNYTVRIYIFLSLLLFLILFSLSLIFRNKSKKFLSKHFDLILGSFLLILTVSIYLLYDIFLEDIFHKNVIYLLSPPLLFSILSFVGYIFKVIRKKKILKILNIFELSFFVILILALLVVSLFAVPHISVNANSQSNRLQSSEEITLVFSSPLKKSELRLNISPNTKVNIELDYFLGIESLIEEIKITPLESFLPDQKIVIYTTGIQRIFPYGTKHENSQEFFTPKAPDVEAVILGNNLESVNITEPITLDLDTQDQDFVEWEAIFTPETEYEIKRDSTKSVIILPKKLKQGTKYTLQVFMNIIKYNPLTLEKISTESEELVKEITFKTTPAPGVKGYNRSSGYISTSEPLIIEFDDAIEESSLEGKFLIEPEVEGGLNLSENGKNLLFTPKASFAKNTEYTITLKAGIENIHSGYIEDDIVITFKTPGSVSLLYSYPRNYSTNVANTIKSVSLTFNQPVDKKSVEERFSISPNISGLFSWDGNILYYSFANNLSYGTKYTISIPSGIKALYGINSSKAFYTSFTTKYQSFLLSVPQYYQQESFTCNLVATRMALGYKGISSSEDGIRNSIGIAEKDASIQNPNDKWVEEYGVHWGPISSYISSRGVSNSVKQGMSLTSALEEVKNGHPILLYVYNGYTQGGVFTLPGGYTAYHGMHSEILVGYIGTPENPQTIMTNDPWRGRRYYYPTTFKSLWAYLGYTGIVIY